MGSENQRKDRCEGKKVKWTFVNLYPNSIFATL